MHIDFYKTRRYIIYFSLALLTFGFLFYCNNTNISDKTTEYNNTTPNFYFMETTNYIVQYKEILDSPQEKIYSIKGFFINKTNRTYDSVKFSFYLFNEQREKIGLATASINQIRPGERYDFTAHNSGLISIEAQYAIAVLVEVDIAFKN